jgi:hypothetical protein
MSSAPIHRRRHSWGASLVRGAIEKPWRARVLIAGVPYHLGYFKSRDEAIAAHALAVKAHLGEAYLRSGDQPA